MNDEHSVVEFASMNLNLIPIRLEPGKDLKTTLEAWIKQEGAESGWVVSGIGSLSGAQLRWAGRADPTVLHGDLEIVTLQGSLCRDGAHLHATVADSQGSVLGGHLCEGSIVRTTAKILIAHLPQWQLQRAADPTTGYRELVIQPRRQ
jgi:predicted DNA-binding protein with PD1-like motif